MKRKDLLTDLRAKDVKALSADIRDAEKKLLDLRFGAAFRKLKSSHDLRATRKQIARLQTIVREKLAGELANEPKA